MTSSPSRPFHWPGGIPPEVRPDASGDMTTAEINEEAKGWLLFVKEKWVTRDAANIPNEDGDYEVRQRRMLVETWAKATQELRDSYQNRAPLQEDPLAYPPAALNKAYNSFPTKANFLCLAPLSEKKKKSHRSNRSKWIKLYILSCRLDGDMGHCLDVYGSYHAGVDANPATLFPRDPSEFSILDFLPWLILEMANFAKMTMTRRGTVLFQGCAAPWFLVNQDDLNTGRITTVHFKSNGRPLEMFQRRAYNMYPVFCRFCGLGKPLREVKEGRAGGVLPEMNAELEMTLPVIDILEGAKSRGGFLPDFDGARDTWAEDIEIYAPGYLQMEAGG